MDDPLWIKKHWLFTDISKEGTLTYEEFETFLIKKLKRLNFEKRVIKKEFKKFDRNNDGFVYVEDLEYVLTKCGNHPMLKEEVDDWLGSEAMKNGKLDYDGKSSLLLILFNIFIM